MDTGTKIRFAIGVAMAIIDFLAIFCFVVTPFGKVTLFVLSLIVAAVLFYFNNTTSKENCEATGEMRLKKEIASGKVTGENFYDDIEE